MFQQKGKLVTSRISSGATYGGDFLSISARNGRTRLIWKEGIAVGEMAAPSPCSWTPQAIC